MTNQEPTFRVCPKYERTLGGAAYVFGESFGIKMDEWQRRVMDDWLAVDEHGEWVCSTCGLSVPRQNGKTALVKVRVMLGIFSLGETILFTCHEVRTSRQVFDALADVLNPDGEYPELASQVQYIKRSNGYEEIKIADWYDEENDEWKRGGKLLFSSRSKGASRGFTADVVVADEAMYMTDEQVSALVPTMASAASGDMQFIMLGTPPSPGDGGTVFAATRESAKNGNGGISWNEWGADCVGDTSDWTRVERFNPSFGTRLMRKAVESEMAVMSPDCFARERLGWWTETTAGYETVIPADLWEGAFTDSPRDGGKVAYAVKFSQDGAVGTLAACALYDDGTSHVEVVESRNMAWGMEWFENWLMERKGAYVVLDGGGNAQDLADRLRRAGYRDKRIMRPTASDFKAATAGFLNALTEGRVTHYIDTALDASATKSAKRKIGKDGFGFASMPDADATLIEACCLAHWCAARKLKPGETKARVAW